MNPIRIGYVGCGFMAQKVHLPNLAALPGCELVALAEVRQELGQRVQSRFAIPKLYRHHLEMAQDPEIDAYAVSAAFAVQGEIARDLLATGRPVFMEKPMAVSVAQAEAIVAASQHSGGQLMVGYMKRYDAGNQLMKELVDGFRASGELGPVTLVRAHGFCGDWVAGLDTPMEQSDEPMPQAETVGPDWLPPEFLRPYLGYLQQYTHNVNLLRFFLGAGDRVRVRSVDLQKDHYTGIVTLDLDGVQAVLETGQLRFHRWDEHTQIYFREGWVHTWAPPLLQKGIPAEVEVYRGGESHSYSRPLPKERWSWSYYRELEHFVQCVRTGIPFGSGAQDTVTDVRLFEEIFKAHLGNLGVL